MFHASQNEKKDSQIPVGLKNSLTAERRIRQAQRVAAGCWEGTAPAGLPYSSTLPNHAGSPCQRPTPSGADVRGRGEVRRNLDCSRDLKE